MRNAKTLRINARSLLYQIFRSSFAKNYQKAKKTQDSESYLVFLVRVARLVGFAHSLLRKHPIMFADREGVAKQITTKSCM